MAPRWAFLLALLLALAPAAATRAAEPMDLTGFIAPLPEVGDYKVFVETGGEWIREEVTAITAVESGWQIGKRYVDAEGDVELFDEVVVPGVESASDYSGGGSGETPPFVAELGGPPRVLALSLSLERALRVSDRWHNFWFLFSYRYKLRAHQRLAGLDPYEIWLREGMIRGAPYPAPSP
jgi:hypothetical protein